MSSSLQAGILQARISKTVHRSQPRKITSRPSLICLAKKSKAKRDSEVDTPPPPTTSPTPVDDGEKDFWEGESWNFLGNIASFTVPAIAALAIGVGLFASRAYNEDASVYLKTATPNSPVILIPANEVDAE